MRGAIGCPTTVSRRTPRHRVPSPHPSTRVRTRTSRRRTHTHPPLHTRYPAGTERHVGGLTVRRSVRRSGSRTVVHEALGGPTGRRRWTRPPSVTRDGTTVRTGRVEPSDHTTPDTTATRTVTQPPTDTDTPTTLSAGLSRTSVSPVPVLRRRPHPVSGVSTSTCSRRVHGAPGRIPEHRVTREGRGSSRPNPGGWTRPSVQSNPQSGMFTPRSAPSVSRFRRRGPNPDPEIIGPL